MTQPFSLDRIRADIAALLHDDPAEIGLDDNLADLGMDSMLLMNLAMQWQEAGIDIDFTQLAETLTIRAIHDALAAAQ
ncbi:MAG: phosphopantetheine-binding protein [Paracoccaceae bacterium]